MALVRRRARSRCRCAGSGAAGWRRSQPCRQRGAAAAGAAAFASTSSIFWMMIGLIGASDLNGPTLAGRHRADAVDDIHALDDLAEDRVTPARRHRIQVRIVGDVNVELRSCPNAARSLRARPTVPRLFCSPLPDSLTTGSWLGFSSRLARRMAAALDDKIADHAMDERIGVVAFAHVAQEVRDREGRAFRRQFDDELAHAGRDAHARRGACGERRSAAEREQGAVLSGAKGCISCANSIARRAAIRD